jgi:hypothetical protein
MLKPTHAVLYEPYLAGISIHLQPVTSMYNTPFTTSLSLGGSRDLIISYSSLESSLNSINRSKMEKDLNIFR